MMDPQRLRDALSLMLGVFDDAAFERLQDSLAQSSPEALLMPERSHSALAEYADLIRSADPRRHPSLIVALRQRVWRDPGSDVEVAPAPQYLHLIPSRYAAPAPYVLSASHQEMGHRCAHYAWWVWMDEMGRAVTTSAELVWD